MHPSSNNCHRKQNPSKKKNKQTNKGPGSLTDTENKTHPRKKNKKSKGLGSLTDTENKTHQKKQKTKKTKQKQKQKNKGPGSAWKLPGQIDRQTL
jgi:hypothetical protein